MVLLNMNKLLVICGPTATGKTSLALNLAKVLGGELVSADSRQVYKGMDIGTGKELPVNSKIQIPNSKLGKEGCGFYKFGGIKIWGYDLVESTENFSVAQYVKIAKSIIEDIWRRGKLPILVGGTGFYIMGVIDGILTSAIPKNESLRKSLESKKPSLLFEILAQLAPIKAASMNVSDRKNPRRLIRAVEIADYKVRLKGEKKDRPKLLIGDVLFIGLKASKDILFQRIDKNVEARVKEGFEKEIKALLTAGVTWNMQSATSLGYKQWKSHVLGRKNKDDVVDEWKKEERKYTRRQLTWFKRDSRINWFDITKPGWQKNVEKLVKKWYSS